MKKTLLPIALDLEMSGISPSQNGIWQIAAIDLNNPEKIFFDEARIDDDDLVNEGSLKVFDRTEEELRNPNKQSQKELIEKFLSWVGVRPLRCFLCQNPQFDLAFIDNRTERYGLKKNFNFRAFDLHSIAQTRHLQINEKFLTKVNGSSGMDLSHVLEFCGIPDKRIQLNNATVVQEGSPHNALEDAKLTGECFSRLIFGKNLFPEYSKYKVPSYLEVREK